MFALQFDDFGNPDTPSLNRLRNGFLSTLSKDQTAHSSRELGEREPQPPTS